MTGQVLFSASDNHQFSLLYDALFFNISHRIAVTSSVKIILQLLNCSLVMFQTAKKIQLKVIMKN